MSQFPESQFSDSQTPIGFQYDGSQLSFTLPLLQKMWAVLLFLMVWDTLWSFGCVTILWQALTGEDSTLWFFGIPFWAAWIGVNFVIFGLAFGKVEASLDSDGFRSSFSFPIAWKKTVVPLQEIQHFKLGKSAISNSKNKHAVAAQLVSSNYQTIDVLSEAVADREVLGYLVRQGNQLLQQLKGGAGMPSPSLSSSSYGTEPQSGSAWSSAPISETGAWDTMATSSVQSWNANPQPQSSWNRDGGQTDWQNMPMYDGQSGQIGPNSALDGTLDGALDENLDDDELEELLDESEKKDFKPEVYTINTPIPDTGKPEKSTWRVSEGLNGVVFKQLGRFSLVDFIGTVLVAAFWNGIVGVFVAALLGFVPYKSGPMEFLSMEWWFLCVFLIPFVLIGLLLLLGVVNTLLAPWWRRVLVFRHGEIRSRESLFFGLLGFARNHQLDDCQTFEIVREKTGHPVSDHRAPSFRLNFLNADEKCVFAIRYLTRDEALWLLREFRYC